MITCMNYIYREIIMNSHVHMNVTVDAWSGSFRLRASNFAADMTWKSCRAWYDGCWCIPVLLVYNHI